MKKDNKQLATYVVNGKSRIQIDNDVEFSSVVFSAE